MKVLSLFDGMACGMIAFKSLGIEVESYDAYEIDKYAIKTATHNFPSIKENGDVFTADFTRYKGVDFVIGGSPCTYWSIAQKNNRETEASGMGWELFSQYVRAIKEAEPKYFIYENNYSMSKAIRESIDKAFGFEAVFINSALVSAQNRKRLYWVGKRNADGTYSKVDVKQPKDRGILLRDILESGIGQRQQDKSRTLTSGYASCSQRDLRIDIETDSFMGKQGVIEPVGATVDEKSFCLTASYNGAVAWNTIERSQRTMVAERIPPYGTEDKARPINALYPNNCGGFEQIWSDNPNKQQVDLIAEPIRVGSLPRPNGELSTSQAKMLYSVDGKSVNLVANGGGEGAKTGLYAIPTNKPVYEVKDGFITIKGKQYPIKLADGYYIIRKLTVTECKRLQTVPEWFEFPVSDAQAYKMLGNGWTIEVIAHLITAALSNRTIQNVQISLFDAV